MTRLPRLTEEEIARALAGAPGWAVVDGKLEKKYRFRDFREAMAFVNRVAEAAEAEQHHPDIAIHYNQVVIQWVTWGSRGITRRDFEMAARCDALYGESAG
ncbi:MAG: 4a-hydroxytetrahydrobiopterin dehydratase [Firmicutes bacterium]|nr:4a-hydroxytetrahydrobiopterin dehydratase [Bacillota bacterium]